jgi:membrane associated rhomboid family serine protease
MPRRRAGFRLPDFLTFGGRVPASIGALIVATALLSIFAWQNRALAALLALSPLDVLGGEVWRVVTWPFVQNDPFGLIFVALMFWWLGPQLLFGWGEGRFLLRLLGITLGAGVVTTAAGAVWPGAATPHVGAWPVMNALLVAWAMRVPDAQVNIWGVLPVTARTLAIGVFGGTVLYALFSGVGPFLPHFVAMGIAYALTRGGFSPGRLFGRAQGSWRERAQKRRASHLKVVKKGGSKDEPPRWMN